MDNEALKYEICFFIYKDICFYLFCFRINLEKKIGENIESNWE